MSWCANLVFRGTQYEVSTFHAFAHGIVKEFHLPLGLPEEPRVISKAEQVLLLSQQLGRLPLDYYAAAAGISALHSADGKDAVSRRFVGRLLIAVGETVILLTPPFHPH